MNKLALATSPYLLQHAHNPVDWYPWGAEALQRARDENKPILVSIGYSSCHWCHVMERESFIDPEVADFMNRHFINIKVDREERPDLDQVYMDAVQILTGRGGWPLNCFLLPDLRPFYGGTYFPPQPRHGMPSWIQLLQRLHQAFVRDRENVVKQAEQITRAITTQKGLLLHKAGEQAAPSPESALEEWYYELAKQFDRQYGGVGSAPKFPMAPNLNLLLRLHHHTGLEAALNQVKLTVEQMLRGGIYDLIGGGLSRYATDRAWHIPHFEKMLYDNAQFIQLLTSLYQLDRDEKWIFYLRDIMQFLNREMRDEQGGYFSALDADSEGEEGKFYTWSWSDLEQAMDAEQWSWFTQHFEVKPAGNWENTNILYLREGTSPDVLLSTHSPWEDIRQKLYSIRANRIRPQRDDKVSTHWNGLMLQALYQAAFALDDDEIIREADRTMNIFLERFRQAGRIAHSYARGTWQEEVFLDDYAGLLGALVERIQLPEGKAYLPTAVDLMEAVIENYWLEETGEWLLVAREENQLPMDIHPLYDYVYPSAGSAITAALFRLGNLLDRTDWIRISEKSVTHMQPLVHGYLSGFAAWAVNLIDHWNGIQQLAIIGPGANKATAELGKYYWPNMVRMASIQPDPELPLLQNHQGPFDRTRYFLCEQYACKAPVENVKELQALRQNVYF